MSVSYTHLDGNMHEVTLRNITPQQRKLERAEDKFKSTRFYVLGQEISRAIAYRKRRRQEKKKILATYEYDLGACMFCQLCVNACPHDAITFATTAPFTDMATRIKRAKMDNLSFMVSDSTNAIFCSFPF